MAALDSVLSLTGHNMDTKMSHNFDTFSWKGLYCICPRTQWISWCQ